MKNNKISRAFVVVFVFLFDDWRKVLFNFSFAVVLAYIGFSGPQYLADKLRNWGNESLNDNDRTDIKNRVKTPNWLRPDYLIFEWIRQIYADQLSNSSQILIYNQNPLPFQISQFRWTSLENYGSGYIVRWSSLCNNEGCRYDILHYGENVIIFSFFARGVKWSERWVNQKPVFIDILGRIIYYNGQEYTIDKNGAL